MLSVKSVVDYFPLEFYDFGGDGFVLEGGLEVVLGGDARHQHAVFVGHGFPQIEVASVGVLVAFQEMAFDAVVVAGSSFRFDKLIVALPIGSFFLADKGRHEDAPAAVACQGDQCWLRGSAEKQVTDQDAHRLGTQGNLLEFGWSGRSGGG